MERYRLPSAPEVETETVANQLWKDMRDQSKGTILYFSTLTNDEAPVVSFRIEGIVGSQLIISRRNKGELQYSEKQHVLKEDFVQMVRTYLQQGLEYKWIGT